MDIESAIAGIKALRNDVRGKNPPPEEGCASNDDNIINFALIRGTRNYLERVAHQINGAYESGWYDASAVMVRRLVEILIIEVYEHNGMASEIKDANGDFVFLRELVSKITSEPKFSLSRSARKSLSELKEAGDKSAHGRYYTAHRRDIEALAPHLRNIVQDLVALAGLKITP